MELEILFNGTPAEFGAAAEAFKQREEAKAERVWFWVERPAKVARNNDLFMSSLVDDPIPADAVLIRVKFRCKPVVVDGKSQNSPNGWITASKLPAGTQLLISAADEDWPELEKIWLMLERYLQKLGWTKQHVNASTQAEGAAKVINSWKCSINTNLELFQKRLLAIWWQMGNQIYPRWTPGFKLRTNNRDWVGFFLWDSTGNHRHLIVSMQAMVINSERLTIKIEQYPSIRRDEYIENGLINFLCQWIDDQYGVIPEKKPLIQWGQTLKEPAIEPELVYENTHKTNEVSLWLERFLVENVNEQWQLHHYSNLGYWWKIFTPDSEDILLYYNGKVTIKVMELGVLPIFAIKSSPVTIEQTKVEVFAFDDRPFTDKLRKHIDQYFSTPTRTTIATALTPITREKWAVLFVAAAPSDHARLRSDQEFREIQEKLKQGSQRERIQLLPPQLSVRPADISQALLDHEAQIVHFSGHGADEGTLIFENADGTGLPVASAAMGALLAQFAGQIECVVLNGCFTATQAAAITQYIPYVIGTSRAISDRAAIAFSVGFYQALAGGRTIDDAFDLGCTQIKLQGFDEGETPVLRKQ